MRLGDREKGAGVSSSHALTVSRSFRFSLLSGSERKTTGSFYTPAELVNELVESALVPVIQQRLAAVTEERENVRRGEREKPGLSRSHALTGSQSRAERALLSLKIVDVACGSGHMLLAAARRVGKELARLRTSEDEPAPEEMRKAIRDVVTHCIYGVDKNPLAVDLCRVALWLESHTAGKPLTFLDHRIRSGDSLVGVFDLAALRKGIPDKAFAPAEGDDKATARLIARRNREEKQGVVELFAFGEADETDALTRQSHAVDEIPDDSPDHIRRKKALYESSHRDPLWLRDKQACDLWSAAFFCNLTPENEEQRRIPTSDTLARHLSRQPIDGRTTGAADALSVRHRFFHWPLEFPEVFAGGGFDVILSNPPWERIKLQELEFFAVRDPRIAGAANKAARARLITELIQNNPALHAEFIAAIHAADCVSKFLRQSDRFPLSATGDINTYAVFAETIRRLLSPNGRAGVILPTGIATDATCQRFFADLNERRTLASLFDYENRGGLFPAVDSRFKFCTLTLTGRPVPGADFGFFLTKAEHLRDRRRRFTLTAEDLALFNPNTRTCPVFRTRADAELTRKIYQHVPVLVREGQPGGNPWGISFLRMFDMANDSQLFRNAPGYCRSMKRR